MSEDSYEILRAKMKVCTDCVLCGTRNEVVVDRGNPTARLLFIGEAPGASEDASGQAFVGPAGQLLDELFSIAGIESDRFLIINILKCLSGNTLVKLADGSTRRINQIVDQRFGGEVLSVDQVSGQLVPRRIIGWHKSPRAGRRMFKLRFKHGKGSPKGFVGARLSEDHQVLTERGWLPVAEILSGVKIATGCPKPGPRTETMIFGTLLGDGCVVDKLQIAHCVGQAEWLGLKAGMLAPFKPRLDSVPQNNAITLRTPAGAYWRTLREMFYPSGRKVVPHGLILTEFSLAVWFMDDGYLRTRVGKRPLAEIATNAFDKADVDGLCRQLNAMGIECRARYGAGWRIKFTVPGTEELSRRIARFVPPSMRYKVHSDFHATPFDATAYAPEPVTTLFDEAIVEEEETTYTRANKTLYCIDVEETHNFVTPGGVVHNCRPPNNDFPGDSKSRLRVEETVQKCLPWLDQQIGLVQPKVIVLVGAKAAAWTVYRGKRPSPPMSDLFGRLIKSDRYPGTSIFAMYHTSYLLRTKESNPDHADELRLKTVQILRAARAALAGEESDFPPLVVRGDEKRHEQLKFF